MVSDFDSELGSIRLSRFSRRAAQNGQKGIAINCTDVCHNVGAEKRLLSYNKPRPAAYRSRKLRSTKGTTLYPTFGEAQRKFPSAVYNSVYTTRK